MAFKFIEERSIIQPMNFEHLLEDTDELQVWRLESLHLILSEFYIQVVLSMNFIHPIVHNVKHAFH